MGFSSAAVERLIDGFWMLTAFLITLHFVAGTPGGQAIPKDLELLVELVGVLLVAGAMLLIWILRHKQESHADIAEHAVPLHSRADLVRVVVDEADDAHDVRTPAEELAHRERPAVARAVDHGPLP